MYEQALDALKEDLARAKATVVQLEGIITSIQEFQNLNIGKLARIGLKPIAGKWAGMTITDAINAILAQSRRPVPLKPLVEALVIGGVDLGKNPDRYESNVKTTIGNNKKRFKLYSSTGQVALVHKKRRR